jgi:hypothetical protein
MERNVFFFCKTIYNWELLAHYANFEFYLLFGRFLEIVSYNISYTNNTILEVLKSLKNFEDILTKSKIILFASKNIFLKQKHFSLHFKTINALSALNFNEKHSFFLHNSSFISFQIISNIFTQICFSHANSVDTTRLIHNFQNVFSPQNQSLQLVRCLLGWPVIRRVDTGSKPFSQSRASR